MANRLWDKLRNFLLHDLWHLDTHELTRRRLFLMRQLQVVAIVVRGFFSDGCMLRASALTYATLLSIVPLLALMFSLIKGFGGQNVLEPLLFKVFTHGSEEVIGAILSYIENTNFRRLGTVGLAILVITVLTLLSNIEKSFNHIWGVKETRTMIRRFSDYFSVVLLSPLLMVAALSLTTSLRSQLLVQKLLETAFVGEALLLLFNILPYLAVWAAFTFMYLFMPNTRVQFAPALVGGIFGGTLWQLAQWTYVNFQVGVSRYNAIYGTMAALPILIVWLYVSWMIVLLGLELTYAMQNATIIREEYGEEPVNFASRERVAMTVLLLCAESFYSNVGSWNHARLCSELRLPPRLVRSVLNDLVRLGLLAKVQEPDQEGNVYHPGSAPEGIEVHAVLQALREDGSTQPRNFRMPGRDIVAEVEATLDHAEREALGGLTLRDMVFKKMKIADTQALDQDG
ncbi:MAG: YihY/virulence factor BrkB family protein [Pedobacter sp.]